jgi:hypothetical protein
MGARVFGGGRATRGVREIAEEHEEVLYLNVFGVWCMLAGYVVGNGVTCSLRDNCRIIMRPGDTCNTINQ